MNTDVQLTTTDHMRLVAISIDTYRSIKSAYKVRLGQSTVLVGPNNEGKSNVLRALVTAMNILTRERFADSQKPGFRFHRTRRFYEWERDYPVDLQQQKPGGESTILLEFELTDAEITDFKKDVKSDLNGTLPLRISIGRDSHSVRVAKKGPGAEALSRKSARIAAFVADRLQFEHIPAVRTASSAQEIVEQLVEKELAAVEENPDYQSALNKIAELQQPILDKLSTSIKGTLVTFLPDVSDVKVTIPHEQRYSALRRACEIVVDDGTPTPLQLKGDGVQSLAALAIMRHASDGTAKGKNLVIAIEEPESHLHPNAIHELRSVLDEMSQKHQIVLTTHNPLFVDRVRVGSNVIVHDKKARPADTIEEIREILGVRASDNLRGADLVLVVEGDDDRMALAALLHYSSTALRTAAANGVLAIDILAGGANLAYKLSLLRSSLCLSHCFLDDDRAGRKAFEKARSQGLTIDADVNFATCPGLDEAELEDLYSPDFYAQLLMTKYRVAVSGSAFAGRAKWSDRLKALFKQHGKVWDDRVKSEVKREVAQLVSADPANALHPARRSAFDALTSTLESRLAAIRAARE